MITITLNKTTGFDENNEEKVESKLYIAPAPKAIVIRMAAQIKEGLDLTNLTTDSLDKLVQFNVDLFGRQFTEDDVYNGISAIDFVPIMFGCLTAVLNGTFELAGKIPNGATEVASN